MARPITTVRFTDSFNTKNIITAQIKENMVLSFNYKSDISHDKNPLVFVTQVDKDRIWGWNLRYKPTLFTQIKKNKIQEIDALIERKLLDIESKSSQLSINKSLIRTPKTIELLKSEVPKFLLEFYSLPLELTKTKYLIRNYLPTRMTGVKQLIFKP